MLRSRLEALHRLQRILQRLDLDQLHLRVHLVHLRLCFLIVAGRHQEQHRPFPVGSHDLMLYAADRADLTRRIDRAGAGDPVALRQIPESGG